MGRVLDAGTPVRFAGQEWVVQQPLGPDAVLLRNESGEIISADPARLEWPARLSHSAPRLSAEARQDDAAWTKATQRRDVLLALARLPVRTQNDIAGAAKTLGLKPRRVWRLLQHGEESGYDTAAFLRISSGPRPKRLTETAEAIIAQAIGQHYAQATRPSLASLHRDVSRRCKAAKLVPPSYRAVQARVTQCDQSWLARKRHGPRKARALRLLTGAHPAAAGPWASVQIDSTPCDIRLVSEIDRLVVGRATVTFALDLYSRAILGFSCSLEAASTLTVATCLAHACRPKDDWLAWRELSRLHWPVYGLPLRLEYDQGPENEARGIQRGLKLHGISSKIRAKGHPEQHGHIERVIGTMMRAVHELPGTTFSNINERGESEPDTFACLSLPELERVLAIAIDSYNHATHGTTGERPIERYLAYYRVPDLPDAARIPPIPSENFLLDFLPYEKRTLRRTGFRLFRVDYSGVDLLPLWRHDNQRQITRVIVYDPRSLAQIWVADETTGEYIAISYRSPHPDMTLAESEALRSSFHAAKAQDRGETRLFDNLAETRAIVENARSATMRRKAERTRQAHRQAAEHIPAKISPSSGRPTGLTGQSEKTGTASAPPPWAAEIIQPFTDVERV